MAVSHNNLHKKAIIGLKKAIIYRKPYILCEYVLMAMLCGIMEAEETAACL